MRNVLRHSICDNERLKINSSSSSRGAQINGTLLFVLFTYLNLICRIFTETMLKNSETGVFQRLQWQWDRKKE